MNNLLQGLKDQSSNFCRRRLGASILVSSALLFLLFPGIVQAQFNYTINSDLTLTITGYTGPGGAVTVPATINGLPVEVIGTAAFQSSTNLTSITFPTSVTTIGDYAFNACGALTNATIGSGVISVGYQAFGYCTKLTSVLIPDNVVGLEYVAFSYGGLQSVIIGNGATNLGSAFENCSSLATVTVGSMATIPQGAFNGCPSLLAINVATNNPYYTSIDGVLMDKSQGTLIQFPFHRSTYAIPDTITNIGFSAFSYCILTNVSMPNTVVNIGESAFLGCPGLLSLTIPNSVTNIGGSAFEACTSLADLTIGESVGTIGDYAFQYCSSLTNLTIPNSVTNLGHAAFAICPSLVNLTLSKRIISMGAQEFAFCTSLANIYIPNSVLGSDEFQGCTGLTNVTVGPTVTLVADGAFLDCSNLTAVYFQGNAPALGGSPFNNNLSIVYYIPGTVGWGPTFAGRPALAIQMQIQVMDASFGIKTNQFGFNITGSYGLTLVIEATTNLVNPIWYRLQTNTLSTGSSYFRDPTWTNYPRRFYRLSWP